MVFAGHCALDAAPQANAPQVMPIGNKTFGVSGVRYGTMTDTQDALTHVKGV